MTEGDRDKINNIEIGQKSVTQKIEQLKKLENVLY